MTGIKKFGGTHVRMVVRAFQVKITARTKKISRNARTNLVRAFRDKIAARKKNSVGMHVFVRVFLGRTAGRKKKQKERTYE